MYILPQLEANRQMVAQPFSVFHENCNIINIHHDKIIDTVMKYLMF